MPSFGHRVHRLPETGSTNDDALRLAGEGAPEGVVVRADRQTQGRGRAGRAWASPGGGLWFSVVLRPVRPPGEWGLVPIAFGCGVRAALVEAGADARLKWPNDVLIGGRKVAGILSEGRPGEFAVAGVGVNVDVPAGALPDDLRERATSLAACGVDRTPDELFGSILHEVEVRYARFQAGEDVFREYREALDTLGREVVYEKAEGRAVGVREDGALVIEASGGERIVVTAGDVEPLPEDAVQRP